MTLPGQLTSRAQGRDHTHAAMFYLNIIKRTQSAARLSIPFRIRFWLWNRLWVSARLGMEFCWDFCSFLLL